MTDFIVHKNKRDYWRVLRAQAVEYRKLGLTYRAIAKMTGMSHEWASQAAPLKKGENGDKNLDKETQGDILQ